MHLAEKPKLGKLADLPFPAGWEKLLSGLLARRSQQRTWTLGGEGAAAMAFFEAHREVWHREGATRSPVG